jgi:hypothetical protein
LLFEIAIANGSMMLSIVTQSTVAIDRVVAYERATQTRLSLHRSFAQVCSTENLLTPFSQLSKSCFSAVTRVPQQTHLKIRSKQRLPGR